MRSCNLTKPQYKALNRLRKRQDIILKPADKGSGVCVLTPQQYTDEAFRQLNDKTTYEKSDHNPMTQIQQKTAAAIEKHVYTGAIPRQSANLLTTPNPQPAKFYLLPKVHKGLHNPPGRPIIAGNNHPTLQLDRKSTRLNSSH
jgi:hypothetical protein